MTDPRITNHGYVGYTRGCRCEICREAKRRYMQDKRKTAAEQSKGYDRYIAAGITHGTYAGYQDARCRCPQCSAAKAAMDRQRYERKRAKS